MTWNFRAVHQGNRVAVYAVYRDADGKITSSDANPYIAEENTLDELVARLTLILSELQQHPPITLPWLSDSKGVPE